MSESLKILLVDDDDYYRGALRKLLMQEKHDVTEAADGKGAQHIISVQPFDLVISDIQMPSMDGISLLKWVKANHSVPVVLITGFSELLETAEACRLGASDFLSKPFRSEEILAAIRKVTAKKETSEQPLDLDEQYCSVPLSDFVTGSRIHFSIFLRITSAKYVRIAYQGEDISLDRIRAYESKGVRSVYVRREDFAQYVGFNLELARKVRNSATLSAGKKHNFLRYTGEVVMKSIYIDNLDQQVFDSAKDFTETALGILSENGDAMDVLDAMNAHADFLYAHNVAVSLYSVIIARAMGWSSSPILFKISIGGLFHDIGLKEIPREILEKARGAMSQEERKLYETHPMRGMEIMNSLSCAPGDAILIAYQHHEDCTGFGYPKKLAKNKIHPMARVVATADQFCEIAIKSPSSPGCPGDQAIERLLLTMGDRLDPEPLMALRKVLGHSAELRKG